VPGWAEDGARELDQFELTEVALAYIARCEEEA
jgi:hypothetical protein